MTLALYGYTCTITLAAVMFYFWRKFDHYRKVINKFPGPPTIALMGNAHQIGTSSTNFFRMMMKWADEYREEGVFRFWLGVRPVITVYRADLIATALGNSIHTKKSIFYKFLYPWLKEGLLLSHGEKWQKRRKMLTPAFHYSMLEDFRAVFYLHADKMVRILEEKANGEEFNIYPYITKASLDIICSTTMGVEISAQEQNTPYVEAVYRISKVILQRVGRPWSYNESVFRVTSLGWEHYKLLHILHDFSRKVIEDRWKEYEEQMNSKENYHESDAMLNQSSKKKRLAFLDLLIENALADKEMTISDIQEEVDTFMFAGHDTTGSALGWIIYNLCRHQKWQQIIRDEIRNCTEKKKSTEQMLTQQEISDLKVLDCFIKESMRMFSTVPAVSRESYEDCKIGKYDCPKGTTIQILISALHKDPGYFPHPERFDPERWMSEETSKRHPFSYIPFSGGLHSCIGQKFAQLEIKIIVVCLLNNFHIYSQQNFDDLENQDGELVLRPSGETLLVKLTKIEI